MIVSCGIGHLVKYLVAYSVADKSDFDTGEDTDVLLSLDAGATRVFDNVWFMSSDLHSEQLTRRIAKAIGRGDKLVVTELADSFKVYGLRRWRE